MTNTVPDERTNSLALYLGDVLTDIATFFAPSGSEQAAEKPRQDAAEAHSDVASPIHKDVSA